MCNIKNDIWALYNLDHSFDELNTKVEKLGTSRISNEKDKMYIKYLDSKVKSAHIRIRMCLKVRHLQI